MQSVGRELNCKLVYLNLTSVEFADIRFITFLLCRYNEKPADFFMRLEAALSYLLTMDRLNFSSRFSGAGNQIHIYCVHFPMIVEKPLKDYKKNLDYFRFSNQVEGECIPMQIIIASLSESLVSIFGSTCWEHI